MKITTITTKSTTITTKKHHIKKLSLLIIIISLVVLNFTHMALAGEYDPTTYLVNSDSDVDGVDNVANDDYPYGLGDGDYTDTQAEDDSYQTIRDYGGNQTHGDKEYRYNYFNTGAFQTYNSSYVTVEDGNFRARLTNHTSNYKTYAQWDMEEGSGVNTSEKHTG